MLSCQCSVHAPPNKNLKQHDSAYGAKASHVLYSVAGKRFTSEFRLQKLRGLELHRWLGSRSEHNTYCTVKQHVLWFLEQQEALCFRCHLQAAAPAAAEEDSCFDDSKEEKVQVQVEEEGAEESRSGDGDAEPEALPREQVHPGGEREAPGESQRAPP